MAAEMVLVGSKHPSGLILNLDKYEREHPGDPHALGVRVVSGAAQVVLKGWSHAANRPDPGFETGGYALTPVPKDFWDAWFATHKDFPMIVDKTILPPHKDAPGQAIGHTAVRKMFDHAKPGDDREPGMGAITAATTDNE